MPVAHGVQVARVDRRAARAARPARATPSMARTRRGVTAVPLAIARRHHRELQRRGQHEALADAVVEAVADRPGSRSRFAFFQARVGHDALGDRRASAGRGARRGRACGPWRRCASAPTRRRDLVVVAVAGLREAAAQVDAAVAAVLPAVEAAVAERGEAGAVDRVAGADDAGLERGERHHHLEGRAGRIGAGDGLVGERAVFVVQQRVPLGRARCRRRSCWGRSPARRRAR